MKLPKDMIRKPVQWDVWIDSNYIQFEKRLLFYRVVKGGGPRGGVSLIFPNVP